MTSASYSNAKAVSSAQQADTPSAFHVSFLAMGRVGSELNGERGQDRSKHGLDVTSSKLRDDGVHPVDQVSGALLRRITGDHDRGSCSRKNGC